ncbi:unnamed protein product, partial [Mesorhabditis belari]|uniref:Uncharacterized protein n=1 Tax=Mesorhabditis belari TaxID=2138241 RepID=A0AAF3EYU1_9BILA
MIPWLKFVERATTRPHVSQLLVKALQTQVRTNAYRASLGRISRQQFLLRYPATLLRPDGSTVEARVAEPRQVIQLAVDLKTLSEDERRQRLAARKPKAKKIKKEEIDDNFDSNEYLSMWAGDNVDKGAALAAADQTASQSAKIKSKRKKSK